MPCHPDSNSFPRMMEGVLEIWAKQLLRKLKRKGSTVEATTFPVKPAVHREEDGDDRQHHAPLPPPPPPHPPPPPELWGCVKMEVAVLDSLVSNSPVDVKQHWTWTQKLRVRQPCECRGGRPGLPVPNSPYGLCGHKATLNLNSETQTSGAMWKWRWPSWPSLTVLMASVDVKQQRTAPRPPTFRLDRRWMADSEWRPAAGCTRENLSLWMMTA